MGFSGTGDLSTEVLIPLVDGDGNFANLPVYVNCAKPPIGKPLPEFRSREGVPHGRDDE
jgi:hypothetical protein